MYYDGYDDEVDSSYEPDEEEESSDDDKYIVKKSQKLGAESLDYSKRKNNKYVATLPGGKKNSFWFEILSRLSYS